MTRSSATYFHLVLIFFTFIFFFSTNVTPIPQLNYPIHLTPNLYQSSPIKFASDENLENDIKNSAIQPVFDRIPKANDGFGFGDVDPQEIKKKLCGDVIGPLDQFRYDPTEAKCSKAGQQGHCPENMGFYGVLHNEIYGKCDCLYNSQRPLIYHADTKRCYFAYEQAYCRKGEWLTFGKNGETGCAFNKCQTPTVLQNKTYVPLNGDGACVLLGKKSEHCQNPEEIISFSPGGLIPKCLKLVPGTRGLALSRQLKCKPGTYLNIVGKCQPPFNWW